MKEKYGYPSGLTNDHGYTYIIRVISLDQCWPMTMDIGIVILISMGLTNELEY